MAETSQTIRVGAVQMCSGVSPTPNLDKIAVLVEEAAVAGATYILTPEVCVAFAKNKSELDDVATSFEGNPAVTFFKKLALKHQVNLHVGSMAVAMDNGKYANRSVVIDQAGEIISVYDKIHLFDADPPQDRPYRESDTYMAGHLAKKTNVAGFDLGMSICFDVRFPALYATLAEAGCEVMAVPAAFTVPTGQAHWEILLRARAIETGSFVIAAAQGGQHENGRKTWGHSMIVDPWGTIIAEKKDDQPGVLVADIDLNRVRDARLRLPVLANRRSFSLSVNPNLP